MLKKLCSLLLISLILLGTVCFADSTPATNENVVFKFKSSGAVVESYLTSEVLIAETVYYNKTDSVKYPILIVCSYDENGELADVWFNTDNISVAPMQQDAISVEFTPEVGHTVKATLIDGLKTSALKPMSREAKMTVDSTDLDSITVNGERIADFSNDKNEYLIQSTGKFEVLAEAKDGSTKVDVKMPNSLPGTAEIDVTSALGTNKKVYVTCYETEPQLLTLKDIKFSVNGQSYSIPNFDPNITEYTVNINEATGDSNANYFYTTVDPKPVAAGSDVHISVLDVNKETVNGVKYRYDTSYHVDKQFAERKAFDNLIPIKNEETKAIINVVRDGGKKTYTVTFTAKQPRLTSYNVNADGGPQPTFVGGAAVNNDNGSSYSTTRSFVMTNVSENLIGASLFPAAYGLYANEWWFANANTGAEYFNFTADTAGTVIVMPYNEGADVYKNEQNGWKKVSDTTIATVVDLNGKSVTYNEYPAGTYFVAKQTYNTTASGARYDDAAYTFSSNSADEREALVLYYAYEKSFDAGEVVSVPVWGIEKSNARADALGIVMIKWAE